MQEEEEEEEEKATSMLALRREGLPDTSLTPEVSQNQHITRAVCLPGAFYEFRCFYRSVEAATGARVKGKCAAGCEKGAEGPERALRPRAPPSPSLAGGS
ncbi:hypothetical protein E2C01_101942 [Portunus trituberculatus]|uniref:Uncharacterized protein n=1 Tax=Portunus trituberculatus TaxID=210409 RepID=A0A5B7KB46_PORTR|nr:hypothetical protein [Portunus trituberculatus]